MGFGWGGGGVERGREEGSQKLLLVDAQLTEFTIYTGIIYMSRLEENQKGK